MEWLFWVSVIVVGLTIHDLLSGAIAGFVKVWSAKKQMKMWSTIVTEKMQGISPDTGTDDHKGYI